MNSNLTFRSNVYPVNGTKTTDSLFLSKIWDYNRIKYLDNKGLSCIKWNDFQRKILEQKPTCAYNPLDPCWGMVKGENGIVWACKCTRNECPLFYKCRPNTILEPDEKELFEPKENYEDNYGYKKCKNKYFLYPVKLTADGSDYGETPSAETIEINEYDKNILDFVSILKEGENGELSQDDIENEEQISGENTCEKSETSFYEDDTDAEVDIEKKDTEMEETEIGDIFVDTSENQIPTIDGIPENIFECFVETSQQHIIEAAPEKSFFVDAGPGTGKTYTLIKKLNYLVSKLGVDAGGILVLCYTNAAVDVIKKRLKESADNGADRSLFNIDVRTFHSFAWWLVSQANELFEGPNWKHMDHAALNYDTSIVNASIIMNRFSSDVVCNWEYFVVDEVQDLTNNLGRFVLNIVQACIDNACGVTVLGDACQAIYDYTKKQVYNPLTSELFYNELFKIMQGKAEFVFLKENHRQGTELITLTDGLREAILSRDMDKMKNETDVFLTRVENREQGGETFNQELLDDLRLGGSISILMRNNGQTLKMSSDLRKRGILHTLNVAETVFNYAPWISDIFADYKKPQISFEIFEELLIKSECEIDPEEVWSRFQNLMHTDNNVLDVRKLLDAIAVSKIDDAILRVNQSSDIVVSNIHRSKGREYDCVIVDRNFAEEFKSDPGEYKTLYVAITRPRKRLIVSPICKKNDIRTIPIYATKNSRWGKTKDKKIIYFEFDSNKDLSPIDFLEYDLTKNKEVKVGDSVYLKRKLDANAIKYEIIHEDSEQCIGKINYCYIKDLVNYMQLGSELIKMPEIINDLYISGIYSHISSSDELKKNPSIKEKSPNGVWKWVDIMGIGHMVYDTY